MKHILLLVIVLLCGTDIVVAGDSIRTDSSIVNSRNSMRTVLSSPSLQGSMKRVASPKIDGLYFGPGIGFFGSFGAHARFVTSGSEPPAYFIDAAAELGYWSEARFGVGIVIPETNLTVALERGFILKYSSHQGSATSGLGALMMFLSPFSEMEYYSTIGIELGGMVPATSSGRWVMTLGAGLNYVIVYEPDILNTNNTVIPSIMAMNIRVGILGRL